MGRKPTISSGGDGYVRLTSGDRIKVWTLGELVLVSLIEAPISWKVHRMVRMTQDEAKAFAARLEGAFSAHPAGD